MIYAFSPLNCIPTWMVHVQHVLLNVSPKSCTSWTFPISMTTSFVQILNSTALKLALSPLSIIPHYSIWQQALLVLSLKSKYKEIIFQYSYISLVQIIIISCPEHRNSFWRTLYCFYLVPLLSMHNTVRWLILLKMSSQVISFHHSESSETLPLIQSRTQTFYKIQKGSISYVLTV